MEEVGLKRIKRQDKQTLGHLIYKNTIIARTLELPWLNNQKNISCIPEDCYEVVKRTSKGRGDHFHIINVPDRTWILIHSGNYAGTVNPSTGHPDIQGCILVGRSHRDFDGDGYAEVNYSKATMKKLNKILPDNFYLKIT